MCELRLSNHFPLQSTFAKMYESIHHAHICMFEMGALLYIKMKGIYDPASQKSKNP